MPIDGRTELPESTPTITRPDLDRDVRSTPKALRPFTVVVLDWTTECSIPASRDDDRGR